LALTYALRRIVVLVALRGFPGPDIG